MIKRKLKINLLIDIFSLLIFASCSSLPKPTERPLVETSSALVIDLEDFSSTVAMKDSQDCYRKGIEIEDLLEVSAARDRHEGILAHFHLCMLSKGWKIRELREENSIRIRRELLPIVFWNRIPRSLTGVEKKFYSPSTPFPKDVDIRHFEGLKEN